MIYRTVTIKAKLNDSVVAVTPTLSGNVAVAADIINKIRTTNYEEYTGPTEFTPSGETQTAETENLVLTSNIIINPIPSNYGLITWNGAALTVS